MAESSLYSVRRRYPPGRMGPTFPARAGHCALRSHARAPLTPGVGFFKEPPLSAKELAAEAALFYRTPHLDHAEYARSLTPEVSAALTGLAAALQDIEWTRSAIHR